MRTVFLTRVLGTEAGTGAKWIPTSCQEMTCGNSLNGTGITGRSTLPTAFASLVLVLTKPDSDMKDRMGVRDRLQDCLHWKESDNLSVRPASYGSERSRSRKSYDAAKAESDPNNASVCRAMRGFVARKV